MEILSRLFTKALAGLLGLAIYLGSVPPTWGSHAFLADTMRDATLVVQPRKGFSDHTHAYAPLCAHARQFHASRKICRGDGRSTAIRSCRTPQRKIES
jgi:hypothetical protein